MNHIPAIITDIKSVDSINVVSFMAEGQNMRMMALELDEGLSIGSEVILGVKATHVALAKSLNGLMSISNQLDVCIERVDSGELLSSVKFRFAGTVLESIITKESVLRMELKEGENVIALVKSSELSIVEVL